MTLELDAVARVLHHHREVSEWTARQEWSESCQLYLIGSERENLRAVTSGRVVVEVHRDTEEGTRGSASLVLSEPDGERLEALIDQAVFMASLNANPPFRLPGPSRFPRVETVDPEIDADPRGTALQVQERVRAAVATEAGVRPSTLEVFVSRGRTRLRTSSEVDVRWEGTSLHVELVLVASQDQQEGESHGAYAYRRAADLDVEREVAAQARRARDQIRARVPGTRRGAVAISGEALASFFGPLTFHTSGSARYRKLSRLEPGQAVAAGEVRGERLSLAADALLPFGLRTAPWDEDGVAGSRVELARDGTVAGVWAQKRYADYLGVPPTGQLGNLVVGAGSSGTHDLLAAEPTLHVETFSWFDPDDVSGDFVAEVRLGYEIAGGRMEPVKGGSVSGNVFAALTNARFSRDATFLGAYQGPELLWLGELTISGR
jgi:predicted Zn-dependent protease